jgi:DNA polymerase III delta prime subunit
MAENAAPTDAPPRRPLHPFFAQNRPVTPTVVKPAVNGTSVAEDDPDLRHNTTVGDKSKGDAVCDSPTRPLKRHKADKELNGDEEQRKARPRKRTRQSVGGGIAGHFVKLKGGSENTAQISVPDTSVVAGGITPDSSNQAAPGADIPHAQRLGNEQPTSNQPESNDHVTERAAVLPATAASSPAKPKKLLQFNPKTGTIGSPPKPKERKSLGTEPAGDGERKRRGRKPLSKIVRIAYGTDSESRTRIAERINGILHNQHPGAAASSKQAAASPVPAKPEPVSKPSKATHPFFLGLAKKTDSTPHDDKMNKPTSSPTRLGTKRYSSTPCSPRKSRTSLTSRSLLPQFGIKNVGLKFPGARLPAWPWQDMVHVRGEQPSAEGIIDQSISFPSRKSKGHAVEVPQTESVLNLITQSMEIPAIAESVRNIYTDHIIPPPPELRLPQKHFESGSKLQIRVLPELRTLQPHLFKKKPTQGQRPVEGSENKAQAPRQLARLFDSIATSLSAFDRSQCETANWAHKYAPISAAEVLQSGPEAFLLKDWLQALTVQSVDTGPAETESSKTGSKVKGAGAGKKKRRKKLDGFIVSSEDEDYELNELSDEDDSWAPSGSRGILRKTVVRSVNAKGKDGDRTANTLVISGPHGCGKTAAVYAVAKELDFEVFEINSSSRRSGKDVLEKIGDMTRNHHVQQHQQASAEDDQHRIAEDEVANDIKSGKQSTMNAFFKPKPGGTKPSVVRPKQSTKASAHRPQNETKKEPAKAQRQSLILLEEVDILYEEDKQFWTTIVSLIAQAKRPFIMTCNDETLVPLHTLRLHGIFRFSTPPRDLAIDRLILIAANEGHAITRHAAEHLYVSRNCDLRAATMDLQYWCQMGVGDRRGGFDWFYPRWPKGVDLDESGRVVRVVSQGTYLPGMNFLGRDSIVDPKTSPGLVEEEIMSQAWESWGLDVGHWQDSVGMEPWAEGLQQAVATPGGRLRTLAIYDDLVEAMSAADIFSCHSFAEFKRVSS